MKRDRLGRFLSPGAARQRGGRSRGRSSRSGGQGAGGTAAARLGWGPTRACGAAEELAEQAGPGRALAMGCCRLCHGKFSSRSLRSISGRDPGESVESPPAGERAFVRDFQRLLGVPVLQDPALSPFVCKNCHAQFYQCHGVLRAFLQRVNVSPVGQRKPGGEDGAQPQTAAEKGVCLADSITASRECLRGLVGWVHRHAASCESLPGLQRTLSSEYCGVVQALWGCGQGHNYTMDTDTGCGALLLDSTLAVKWEWDKEMAPRLPQKRGTSPAGVAPQDAPGRGTPAGAETTPLPGLDTAQPSLDGSPVGSTHSLRPQPSPPPSGAPGHLSEKQLTSSTSDDRVKDEFSDLSEGDFSSDGESDRKQNTQSSDESFELPPGKKVSGKKSDSKEAKKSEEPKIRKKPGPKPGWKKQLRCEREELPTIFKCPYQGCTAVYRGADGMKVSRPAGLQAEHAPERGGVWSSTARVPNVWVRGLGRPLVGGHRLVVLADWCLLQKHIKEHHEEVRERPCPHPGCNKVFMIDRYLQRHVKLIHTEVRNYICDECGQTFKQRKHLLVHQMRHSGAKPLQCEVCGFQCRQRASLKYHMTKHKAETELDFACDQCGRRFEKAHNLNVHMSMVHPLTQTQERAKALEAEPPPRLPSPSGDAASQVVKPEPT
ncbi:zinc finger protein 276 isoform X2 [Choloepus didactylus]|uniref:zinc finger protein 276 isoform X2 n=1 Tax=Choloepus didactylus TaxID=27675 RepID=UPI0018A00DED|nr:zinc finger protein 276 isoform X2 [Choloepus didactylus]